MRHVKSEKLYFVQQERRSDEIESHMNISSGRVPLYLTEFFSSLKFSLTPTRYFAVEKQ